MELRSIKSLNMREIFNDPGTENTFRKQGFIILPFVNETETLNLKQSLMALNPSDHFKGNQSTLIGQQSFHITFFDQDKTYKQAVYNTVKDVFSSFSQEHLKNYKCAQANVFLKPGGKGFVFPHQNLTIVDEEKYTSLSFWLPLQDTNFENGTICLIPGSQYNFVKYRNTHVFWPYVKFFIEGKGLNYFVPVNVKAGEILIIDDRLIHYTPINSTTQDRWVVHSLWAPKEVQLRFCDPHKTEVKIYHVDDEFWQFHPPGASIQKTDPDSILINDEFVYNESELIEILENLKKITLPQF